MNQLPHFYILSFYVMKCKKISSKIYVTRYFYMEYMEWSWCIFPFVITMGYRLYDKRDRAGQDLFTYTETKSSLTIKSVKSLLLKFGTSYVCFHMSNSLCSFL